MACIVGILFALAGGLSFALAGAERRIGSAKGVEEAEDEAVELGVGPT